MNRSVVLLATLTLLLSGCSRGPGPVAAARVPQVGSTALAVMPALERFVINDVESARDGGSILVRGYLSKTVNLTLKFDGATQSLTYGGLFIATYHFMQANQPLAYRPLTPAEAATLLPILKATHSRVGHQLNGAALVHMIDVIEAFNPAPAPAPVPIPVAPVEPVTPADPAPVAF